jgi:hypothetical protein
MRIESNLPNAPLGSVSPDVSGANASRPGFSQALEKVMEPPAPLQIQSQVQVAAQVPAQVKVIQSGDTLTSIVRDQAQQQGVKLSPSEEFRWTQTLAADSGIKNPNAIFPGQKIQLQNMLAQWQNGQTQPNTLASANNASNAANAGTANAAAAASNHSAPTTAAALSKGNYINAVANPVLSQTLDRAVARGFIPKGEKQDVYNKVLQVANKHKFSPDDFARLTLMESDGMNPQATNARCHGIIQFCDGPARGAAEVGFGKAPKQILGLSVYQQLHLVDTYFDKAGLKKEGPVALDELYLAVLHPAARGEKRPEEPLGIPGKQAKVLYEGRDPEAPMTRVSIAQGLVQNAAERLGFKNSKTNSNNSSNAANPAGAAVGPSLTSSPLSLKTLNSNSIMASTDPSANAAARIRLQVQKAADYEALEAPKVWLR